MAVADNTPVIIGAATVSQRQPDPAQAAEASELMIRAAQAAAQDAAAQDAAAQDAAAPPTAARVLSQLELVAAMASLSGYLNPAKLVAEAVGSPDAHTLRADAGILQQEVFNRVASAIQQGQLEVALVVSGETSYRTQQARIAGVDAPNTDDRADSDHAGSDRADSDHGGNQPDTEISPEIVIHPHEIEAGLTSAVSHYSALENAYRHRHSQTKTEQADQTSQLWERFSQVAAQNPDAWNRQPASAHDIATVDPKNRMMAYPYAKRHCSQMNVDQAAALLFCSAGKARALGVASDRWIFPHAGVICNHAVPILPRAQHHLSPGFRLAGQRLEELCGVGTADAELVDLYSCFPVAVKIQADELGLGLDDRSLTITGGMPFAGGPFNSYVLHSLCAMVDRLRERPRAQGLVTSISGMVTKQGVGLWSGEPPEREASFEDITDQVSRLSPPVAVDPEACGRAEAVTYTVLFERAGGGSAANSGAADSPASVPVKAVAIAEFGGDQPTRRQPTRRLASTTDADIMQAMMSEEEFCGRDIEVAPDGSFVPR